MIVVTDKSSTNFRRTIRTILEEKLKEQGFEVEKIDKVYQNTLIDFVRKRSEIKEKISLGLVQYFEWHKEDFEIDDEVGKPIYDKEFGWCWDSLHRFFILVRSYSSNSNLLPTGKLGLARIDTNDDRWYFKDEEDLRNVIEEKVLPLLLTKVMEHFDETLLYSVKDRNQDLKAVEEGEVAWVSTIDE